MKKRGERGATEYVLLKMSSMRIIVDVVSRYTREIARRFFRSAFLQHIGAPADYLRNVFRQTSANETASKEGTAELIIVGHCRIGLSSSFHGAVRLLGLESARTPIRNT